MRASKEGDYARLNMPFELGINYGFRVFGGKEASEEYGTLLTIVTKSSYFSICPGSVENLSHFLLR